MLRLQRAGVKAVLPQVTGFPAPHIEPAGIVIMRPAEGFCQPGLGRRHGDDVDVVPHQAISGDGDPAAPAVLRQEAEVHFAIDVAEEDCLLPVAALRDVVPAAGHDDPRYSRHDYYG